MVDIGPWKKYPEDGQEGEDSWRLDHPHFQNVQRVTYAKGVIKDFKLVDTDPIKVESMVKVEIEGYGQTEDYIPLFYHPKVGYWDTDEIKATDFDEEQKCHKQAWMSFRGDDEVIVVMEADPQEKILKPKFVLGFADNYPRIGEDVFKVTGDQELWVQFSQRADYPEEDTGPDDLPLQLVTECERVDVVQDIDETVEDSGQTYAGFDYKNGHTWAEYFNGIGNWYWEADEYYLYFPWQTINKEYQYKTLYLIPLGPYLVILIVVSYLSNSGTYYGDAGNETFMRHDSGASPPCGNPECDELAAEYLVYLNSGPWLSNKPNDNIWYEYIGCTSTIAAALYTEENLAIARNPNLWQATNPPPPFVDQAWPTEPRVNVAKVDPNLNVYHRPHTKEELTEAGLLMEDGSLPNG